MPDYRAPGVYVQEVPSGTNMIGRVGTSSAGFVGVAAAPDAPQDVVVTVDNWTQFADTFVGDATTGTDLVRGVYGFFQNGGGRAYVVNVGAGGSLTGTARRPTGLTLLEAVDDVAIVVAPGYTGAETYDAIAQHCENELLQDRVGIVDLDPDATVDRLLRVGTVGGGPAPATADEESSAGTGDTPEGGSGSAATGSGAGGRAPGRGGGGAGEGGDGARPPASAYLATYWPYLVTRCPVSGELVPTPPSGHLAGVWARTDATRGVHKAPANTRVFGALDLTRRVSRGDQMLLNPAGVNCIRYFSGEGILVWGARTLDDGEYRYINVRRLVNMIKESILDGTRWAVFEPNHHPLWSALRRDVTAFLMNVWRDGALVGTTPDQAFFVKCDEETNPPEVRDAGMVVTVVGIAPVKPAEFVVFKLMQSADATEIEATGVLR